MRDNPTKCPKCGKGRQSTLVKRGEMWLCVKCADSGDRKLIECVWRKR